MSLKVIWRRYIHFYFEYKKFQIKSINCRIFIDRLAQKTYPGVGKQLFKDYRERARVLLFQN